MGNLDGKVAFITGAARGQGRSHALKLAEAGVDIIAVDICSQIDTVGYPMATADDLEETTRLVEKHGGRIIARQADVRSLAELQSVVGEGLEAFGRLDIVLANAGVGVGTDPTDDLVRAWANVVDVNLTGVWNTVMATKQAVVDGGRGGSIVLTSSTAAMKVISDGSATAVAYGASKHGVIGIMRAFAVELAPHSIRVNSIHPTGVATPMVENDDTKAWIDANADALASSLHNLLPVELIEPGDVSDAILWLVSDSARYITGVTLPVDAGFTAM